VPGGAAAGQVAGRAAGQVAGLTAGQAAQPDLLADVGCGPGHVTAYLASLGAPVIGLDLSPAMVATARAAHPALRFSEGDLRKLPTGDASWGGAVCLYTIIHLDPDGRREAYAELARTIRPGGWLLVSFHTHHLEQDVAPVGPSTSDSGGATRSTWTSTSWTPAR
jgi:SAM-dependent methyltransferase